MEIKKFISTVLDELQDLKSTEEKKRYFVEELEFELGVVLTSESNGNIKFNVFAASTELGADLSKENIQKVKIRLKPKANNESQHNRQNNQH